MGVTSQWMGSAFEEGFYDAIGKELVKSASILRRNLSTVLATTGKSPPASPKSSDIPFNRTGTLARSWHASPKAHRAGDKFTAGVATNVKYAWWLHVKAPADGGRNFMDENLYWYQKTVAMIEKRLDPQRLIKAETGRFRI